MKRVLVSVAIFWQNDKPGGAGVIIIKHPADSDLAESLTTAKAHYDQMWADEATTTTKADSLASSLLEQLKEYAALPESERETTARSRLFFRNVYLLTKHKYMADDEYNGISYQYALQA